METLLTFINFPDVFEKLILSLLDPPSILQLSISSKRLLSIRKSITKRKVTFGCKRACKKCGSSLFSSWHVGYEPNHLCDRKSVIEQHENMFVKFVEYEVERMFVSDEIIFVILKTDIPPNWGMGHTITTNNFHIKDESIWYEYEGLHKANGLFYPELKWKE